MAQIVRREGWYAGGGAGAADRGAEAVAAEALEHWPLRAPIGESVGQRNVAVTANTYSHVLADERELDYATMLSSRGFRR